MGLHSVESALDSPEQQGLDVYHPLGAAESLRNPVDKLHDLQVAMMEGRLLAHPSEAGLDRDTQAMNIPALAGHNH